MHNFFLVQYQLVRWAKIAARTKPISAENLLVVITRKCALRPPAFHGSKNACLPKSFCFWVAERRVGANQRERTSASLSLSAHASHSYSPGRVNNPEKSNTKIARNKAHAQCKFWKRCSHLTHTHFSELEPRALCVSAVRPFVFSVSHSFVPRERDEREPFLKVSRFRPLSLRVCVLLLSLSRAQVSKRARQQHRLYWRNRQPARLRARRRLICRPVRKQKYNYRHNSSFAFIAVHGCDSFFY